MSALARRLMLIAVLTVAYVLPLTRIQIGFGNDYCSLYHATRLLLAGQSPYGPQSSAYLAEKCVAVQGGAGFAYPMPFALLLAPLGWLPFFPAAFVWTLTGAFLAMLAFLLVDEWPPLLLLTVLFVPFFRAMSISQSTLVWFGVAMLMVWGVERRAGWLVGLCVAVLPWKPQAGLLFALAGAYWAWHNDRRALGVAAVGIVGLLGLSFVVLPHWLPQWWGQSRTYEAVVETHWWGWWALPMLLAGWRLPWWARLGMLQFALFPINDPYAALPLMLAWISLGGWPSLAGAALSWLYPLGIRYFPDYQWLTLIVPLIVFCLVWGWKPDGWRAWLRSQWTRWKGV